MTNAEEHSGGEENTMEDEILRLRGRWELASVLNFFDVFSSILGKEFKLSAEELEIGIVKPDSALAQLHIQLLKGIPPVNKNLVNSDKWVTALCKKLAMWWSWVAEGKIPLVPSNGEEISKYKELTPLDRLRLLKALCEVRAEQNDAVSYINDSLKEGTELTSFRKVALGRDGTDTSIWYDANAKCKSHRLYREIITSDSSSQNDVNGCLSIPINFQWETLASNLEEFSKAAETFSCSKSSVEVAISKKLESDVIPVLEKLKKNEERAAIRKQRQEMLSTDFRNYCSGNTRSCRTRRPVNYSLVQGKGLQALNETKTQDQKINPTARMIHQRVIPNRMWFPYQTVMILVMNMRIVVTVRSKMMMLIVVSWEIQKRIQAVQLLIQRKCIQATQFLIQGEFATASG
ncbi:DDT domain-containing protein DDR4 isoform X2 [Arachis ipaensis]|uniref:DDT domain-containing protein DDR4 isoform X2 n=1 Tax=Arachis ipaensis TaxID=130454 RepID=UPI000A2B17E8|nr:DDT domain-containing protein DDR4 isoform X2 [Arachis ipaensis]XP_025671187.1 DDT domain-containing protein DDR4 isoform X2 [Arachis hypogaea]